MFASLPVRFRNMLLGVFRAALAGGMVIVFSSEARTEIKSFNLVNTTHSTKNFKQHQRATVHLYFADRDYNFLTSEQRTLRHMDEPAEYAEAIVEALIKGPRKKLLRIIPTRTILRAIYITSEGICYVDFSEEIRGNHPGGCNSELLTVYSIVNSLILNLPEITRVKILVNGNEAKTLTGHCDLELPLQANMLLIR